MAHLPVSLNVAGHTVVISECDLEFKDILTVCIRRSGYKLVQITSGEHKGKSLANAILSPKAGHVVDHVDRDTLNNTRENLRLATKSQNMANSLGHRSKASGLPKGVFYRKSRDHYFAKIKLAGIPVYLGSFATPEQAKSAYDTAAKLHFGEFAT